MRLRLAKLGFELVDDIGQSLQILFDAFKTARRFLLFHVKARRSRRVFKNRAALFARALEERFHATLFDNRVSLRPETDPADYVAEVLQSRRLSIDKIFGFPAAIDAPR